MDDKKKPVSMQGLARIIPYAWPFRKRLLLSCFFAMLVALFWGLNLSIAFPIIKVLLEGQNLSVYVQGKIELAEKEVELRTKSIASIDQKLDDLEGDTSRQAEERRVRLLGARSHEQTKLSVAAQQESAMSWLDQHVIRRLPEDKFDMLALILGGLLLATLLKGYFTYMQDQLTGSVVELTVMGIRKDCFRKVLRLDYQTISREGGTPGLMSRFTFDTNVLARGMQLMGGKFLREPLKAITCIVFAFMVNWRLTLLSLVFVPVTGVVFYRFGRSLKKASHRMMESMSRICKTLEEAFDAIKVVKAYGGERRHRARFHRENKEYLGKAIKIVRIDSLTSPSTELLGMCAIFVSLLPGAFLVLRQKSEIWNIRLSESVMDIAELGVLYVLLAGILEPMRRLSVVYAMIKRSSAAAERIFSLMDREPLVKETSHPVPLPRHEREIEFRNIEFSYAADDDDERPPALVDVSLTVAHGETIVVVGENGSGKSTLVNLLPRFYDPQRGEIFIDGVEIRKTSLQNLRRQMAVVTQETMLFDDTIYENIRYGNPDASHDEIVSAARRAHVSDFLEDLPGGINTSIGEKGNQLSGGQKQRIALARAIVRDPAIVILDEATSAIDSHSELLIHETLRNFLRGRTSFIITHSVTPSMLAFTSRIVVMDRGRVLSQGTHEKLIAECPQYQKLFHARRAEAA